MSPPPPHHITIVGAGLAGALLACFLGRRGYRVDVYERRPDPRPRGFIGGRSINLALSTRGIDALRRVGLAERVLADAIPMRGRMMHSARSELTSQPYSKDPQQAINSVSRGGLNITLLNAAEQYDTVRVHFSHRCEDIDPEAPCAVFVDEEQGAPVSVSSDLVIGADGAFSAVRGGLQKTDRFSYSQHYLEHGYKELTIPPTSEGTFALEPHALHIWPRGGYMMIALPNKDRSFTCTLFWAYSGPDGFDAIRNESDIVPHFAARFPDAIPVMPTLVEDYQKNPVSSLVTIRCDPWHYRDRVLLLGDAAHAIIPFYGQGMNAAFEDCTILDQLIEQHGGDWEKVLPAFTASRKANADAIAGLAMENFIEMRDKVKSRWFLMQKKLEKTLHRWLPRWFTPLYHMVTFTTIPYAEARRRAGRQRRAILIAAATLLALLLLVLLLFLWIMIS